MLLHILHQSRVASALAAAAPAPCLAFMGEKWGGISRFGQRERPMAPNSCGTGGAAPLSAHPGCLLEKGGSRAG